MCAEGGEVREVPGRARPAPYGGGTVSVGRYFTGRFLARLCSSAHPEPRRNNRIHISIVAFASVLPRACDNAPYGASYFMARFLLCKVFGKITGSAAA